MNSWKEQWDRERFSDREKQDLTARLARAAEQEDNMDGRQKKRVFRLGWGAVAAVAAAWAPPAASGPALPLPPPAAAAGTSTSA